MPLTKRLSSHGSLSNLLSLVGGGGNNSPRRQRRSGGRAKGGRVDNHNVTPSSSGHLEGECCWSTPCKPNEARLTIVHITDVYTLDNFANLKTLLQTIRANRTNSPTNNDDKVISVLTGDFVSPPLLSRIDRGQGMVDALEAAPIDYVVGCESVHRTVCCHTTQNFPGTWLNTNMKNHQQPMQHQKPYEIIEVTSPDGTISRRIGLIGILSNSEPELQSHCKSRGAFAGTTIDDPWEAIQTYKTLLEEEYDCDVVIPLQHLHVPEDHKTCKEFDFPVVLSGHDHHKVDEVVQGTRLVKPGMDGVYASVVELIWKEPKQPTGSSQSSSPKTNHKRKSGSRNRKNGLQGAQRVSDASAISDLSGHSIVSGNSVDSTAPNHRHPDIRSTFVEVATFEPCPILKEQTDKACDALLPLQESQLMNVPPCYEPLSSRNARGSVCTMGSLICSLLKATLNQKMKATIDPSWSDALTQAVIRQNQIDAVLLMGANIRGGQDYPPGSFFSLKMLQAEINSDEVVAVVPIPGSVLAQGIEVTHAGDPMPGWMQYDDGIREEIAGEDGILRVTMVGDQPLDPNRTYRVATKIRDLTSGRSPPLQQYFAQRPDLLPAKGSYFNIQTELMNFFARNFFRKLWEAIETPHLKKEVEQQAAAMMGREVSKTKLEDAAAMKKVESKLRLAVLDQTGDGIVSVEEIHTALRDILGLSVSDDNLTLAKHVHSQADTTGDGLVNRRDFEHFCTAGGLPAIFGDANDQWDEAFSSPTNHLAADSSTRITSKEVAETGLKDDSSPTKTEVTLLDNPWPSGSSSGDHGDDVGLMI